MNRLVPPSTTHAATAQPGTPPNGATPSARPYFGATLQQFVGRRSQRSPCQMTQARFSRIGQTHHLDGRGPLGKGQAGSLINRCRNGIVKITPIIAAGMEAETVNPAYRPR